MDNICYKRFMEDMRPLLEKLVQCEENQKAQHTASGQLRYSGPAKECIEKATRELEAKTTRQCGPPETYENEAGVYELFSEVKRADFADESAIKNRFGQSVIARQAGSWWALYRPYNPRISKK